MASPGASAATKASSGKKKGTTLHLTSFLKPAVTSWADEDPDNDAVPLPTAPGASLSSYGSQGGQSNQSQPSAQTPALPSQPPFKAYVANLAHNITAQEIGELFHATYEVVDVHILKHQDTQRVKGAFVEFATQEDLRGGLSLHGHMLAGRPLRVDVAMGKRGNPDARGYDDRSRYDDRRGDRGGYSERGSGYGDGRDRQGGYDYRGSSGGGYQDRGDYGPPRGGQGNRGGFPDRRGGPDGGYPDRRGGNSGYSEEDAVERWGHSQPQASINHHQNQQQSGAPPSSSGPVERRKLVLAPRSAKAAEDETNTPTSEADADKSKKLNPFGAAKPINAEARLREIEEKAAKEKAEVAARAAAREAEQRAKEQTSEASQLQYRDQETAHSAGADDSRPTGSGRLPGPPPGQGRNAGPPPSGSGRGQGRGASLDAANGRLSLPPGIEPGRDDHGGRGGRGRRGRGREVGRGRGDYGGRGRPPPPPYGDTNKGPAPTAILSHRDGGPDSAGFQEAGAAKGKSRSRGWEAHTVPPAPKHSESKIASQIGDVEGGSKDTFAAKASNKFEMLTLDE